jgi:hypothetical protein
MDNDHFINLENVILFGDLFFFTCKAIRKGDRAANVMISDLYATVSFN